MHLLRCSLCFSVYLLPPPFYLSSPIFFSPLFLLPQLSHLLLFSFFCLSPLSPSFFSFFLLSLSHSSFFFFTFCLSPLSFFFLKKTPSIPFLLLQLFFFSFPFILFAFYFLLLLFFIYFHLAFFSFCLSPLSSASFPCPFFFFLKELLSLFVFKM